MSASSILHRPLAAAYLGAQPNDFYFSHQSNFFQTLGFGLILDSVLTGPPENAPKIFRPAIRLIQKHPKVVAPVVAASAIASNYFFELSGHWQQAQDWTDFSVGMAGVATYGLLDQYWPRSKGSVERLPTEGMAGEPEF